MKRICRCLCLTLLLAGTQGCRSSSDEPDPNNVKTARCKPLFADVSKEWGVSFVDSPRDPSDYRLSKIMGSGCAILDFDRNSLPDILFVASDSEGANVALFRQDAPGRFCEVAQTSGLNEASGTGIAVGDCNNDGWPDLYLTSEKNDQLWLNDGGTGFRNITEQSGLKNTRWGTAACWLDYNRDGWLDLFVTNYVDYSHRPCTRLGGGDADFCGPHLFPATPDVLFRNATGESTDGIVSFVNDTAVAGIISADSAGLGVTAKDFTGDGWIDVYVASDQRPNLLWVNQQGRFANESLIRGCDVDFQGRSQASMGLAFGDTDSDGREDLVVSHLDGESHAVYRFRSDGLCQDVSREHGFGRSTRPYTGFGVVAADFFLDGSVGVLTANGRVKRTGNEVTESIWGPYKQPLQLLVRSQGGSFRDVVAFSGSHVARGLAVADLDRDGDIDAVVSCIGEPALILRNDHRHQANWIGIRVVDPALGGRSCPGAEVSVRTNQRTFELTFQPCQSYASSHLDEVIIAVPKGGEVRSVDVTWPHGSMNPERFSIAGINETVTLSRGSGKVVE